MLGYFLHTFITLTRLKMLQYREYPTISVTSKKSTIVKKVTLNCYYRKKKDFALTQKLPTNLWANNCCHTGFDKLPNL